MPHAGPLLLLFVVAATAAAAAAVGGGLKKGKTVVERKRTQGFIRVATLTGADGRCTTIGWRAQSALNCRPTTTTHQFVYGKHDRSIGTFRR